MTTPITLVQIDLDAGFKKSGINKSMRHANGKSLRRYLDTEYRRHFDQGPQTAPGGSYGYAKRDPKYVERKQRRFGHSLPMVLTGRTRRYVRNNSVIRKTAKRGTLQIKNYYKMTPERRRELSAIDRQDQSYLTEQHFEAFESEIWKPENRRKRRKRV